MKTALLRLLLGTLALTATAATTINPANKFAYGANIGWMDWRGDTSNGAVIGEFVCSGFIYAANVGWIHLGDGMPTNNIRYRNLSVDDFGVNHDGTGNLSGLAYGANIGWINFTNRDGTGATFDGPKVDLLTGRLSGFVWSANCGWIGLSNSFAFVQTDSIQMGIDSDGDGLADAWELQYTNGLPPLTGGADSDGDGVSNASEYLADTNPLDASSTLRITTYSVLSPGFADDDTVSWTSRPTRVYRIQYRTDLNPPTPWLQAMALSTPDAGPTTTRTIHFDVPSPQRYFRVEAVKPLSP
jgi:hypothetical protein